MGDRHIPIIDEDKLDDIITALQALSAPSGTDVAISPTGMHIVTEDDVQGAISELDAGLYATNQSLTQLIRTEYYEIGTQSIAQDARGIFTKNVALAGYTPIGIIQISLSSNYMDIGSFAIDITNGNLQIVIWNYRTQANQTVYARVLYVKNFS